MQKIAEKLEGDESINRWTTENHLANIAVHTTMLNGVFTETYGFKPPADYVESFREYCRTIKRSGERVLLIVGGCRRFWSIRHHEKFNALRYQLIRIAIDEFLIPTTNGMQW